MFKSQDWTQGEIAKEHPGYIFYVSELPYFHIGMSCDLIQLMEFKDVVVGRFNLKPMC